ncbi:hypothetical protein K458DRAFT_424947 [Lentithecium fluviatile CBS 122367]|uniref:DUF3176 domain containing protein n=1 Tax=Lentithecium fluviatile CBS 122367 TaxID=1168545 RepID=A0A6G1IDJ8_9PLEO|nr:hypothetical protein K458DRAFT_424947 [Lentithecium fluviatile CBS 122367]
MSNSSPYWLHHPNIPIYLDTVTETVLQHPDANHTCATCKTSSHDQPIHCVSTNTFPAPPPYSTHPTVAASVSSSTRGPLVPLLDVDTSRNLPRLLPPRPALRFDPAERSRVRFRRATLSPHSDAKTDDVDFDQKPQLGLGIPEAPFHPDISPTRTPAIESMEKAEKKVEPEKNGGSPNLAQRIEQKLWKYSASGNVAKRWLLEIVSWTLSAASMGAIIGVLLFLNNKPTPSWPFGLTLNAYISVFSKVSSAALLLPISEALGQLKWLWFQGSSKKMWDFEIFDNASRGPWGAFLLLVRTKGTTLAALGAAITIFALALDPFFQQVVEYPPRMALNAALNSTIPRVVQYQPSYDTATRAGVEMIQLEQDMQAVALKFLYEDSTQPLPFGKDVRPDIPLSCPTSNCTWPEHETLGVCSTCEDISELLTYDCLTGPLDWIASANATLGAKPANGTMCGWFINATIPDPGSRPVLMSGHRKATANLPDEESLLTRVLPLVSSVDRSPLYGTGSYRFKDVQNAIIDFFVVSTADKPGSAYSREPPVAHECLLAWCVKTIKPTYFEATYSEQVTKTFTNMTPAVYPWKSIPTITPFGPGNIQEYGRDIQLNYNGTQYGASTEANVRATFIFDDYFPSVYLQSNESGVGFLRYKMQYSDGPPFLRNVSYNPFLAPNNVSHHMERLAAGLTNVLRSSDQHVWVEGDVFSIETFVRVRWAWLSLPLGLLVFTLLFLVGTVIKSSLVKEHVGVWKTSAIATLLYGLPDEMQKKITAPAPGGVAQTPRAKAKELKVKMLPKMGWRLSGNLFSPFTPKIKQSQPPPGWI